MARHSGVEMVIDAARLPLSPAASAAVAVDQSLLAQILGGGDDYELAFTVPAAAEESLRQVAAGLGVAITRIGQVTKQGVEGGRVWVQDDLGRDVTPSQLGYRHFRVQSEGREAPRGA